MRMLSRLSTALLCGIVLFLAGCHTTNPVYPNPTPGGNGGYIPPNPPVVQPPSTSTFYIGTFDDYRNGGYSFANSTAFSQARSGLYNNFPNARLISFPTITAQSLSTVRALVIHVLYDTKNPINGLSSSEQQALLSFIASGGSVLIMTDHVDFDRANNTFLAAFNMSSRGVVKGTTYSNISNANNPISNGPFGNVASFSQHWAGSFNSVPSNAIRVASNQGGDAIVVFADKSISPQSGGVVILSDASMFMDDKSTGVYTQNERLYLNILDFLIRTAR